MMKKSSAACILWLIVVCGVPSAGCSSAATDEPMADMLPADAICMPLPQSHILTQTCGPSTETDSCRRCQRERCCELRSGCEACGDCYDNLRPCLNYCYGLATTAETGKCSLKCYDQYPKGLELTLQWITCSNVRCAGATECGGGVDPDVCLQCLYTKCTNEYVSAYATVNFAYFEACIVQCAAADTACGLKCMTQYPQGSNAGTQLLNCRKAQCKVACP